MHVCNYLVCNHVHVHTILIYVQYFTHVITSLQLPDEPKPPGPVELDENVAGTVTVSWTASPDEKLDDRLYYKVTKRDSSKPSWRTVADRIFNNKYTHCNLMSDREYQFKVYAKNDMGTSKSSMSVKWSIPSKKGDPLHTLIIMLKATLIILLYPYYTVMTFVFRFINYHLY